MFKRTSPAAVGLLATLLVTTACGPTEESATTTSSSTTVAASSTTTTEATSTTTTVVPETTTTTEWTPDWDVKVYLWDDYTDQTIGTANRYTNQVDLADLDGDGDLDILFADGGDYEEPGTPQVNHIFINNGAAGFEEMGSDLLGDEPDIAKAIRAADVNGDGMVDLFIGAGFETQSRLFLSEGDLAFTEVTATNLPQGPASVSDVEFGDVDLDGDLDLVLADRGEGNPWNSSGVTMLWLNDGAGVFTDATASRMPSLPVQFPWEVSLADVDSDFDIDILVACRECPSNVLLINDGSGTFSDGSGSLPPISNNYDFAVVDVNGDGHIDLLTVNSGADLGEQVLIGDGTGVFVDATEELIPDDQQAFSDDNKIVMLDYDSDGDPDFLISTLANPFDGSLQRDPIMINDGNGHFTRQTAEVFAGRATAGSLYFAIGDLNGDGLLDVVQAQGEADAPNRVHFANTVAPDSAPPIIGAIAVIDGRIHARVHDNKTPVAPFDWQRVWVSGPEGQADMTWYGEALWHAPAVATGDYTVCAIDNSGNEACSEAVTVG